MLFSLFKHFPNLTPLLKDLERNNKSTIVHMVDQDVAIGNKYKTVTTQYVIQARLGLDQLEGKQDLRGMNL